jgi:hypothetical protein
MNSQNFESLLTASLAFLADPKNRSVVAIDSKSCAGWMTDESFWVFWDEDEDVMRSLDKRFIQQNEHKRLGTTMGGVGGLIINGHCMEICQGRPTGVIILSCDNNHFLRKKGSKLRSQNERS